MRRTTLAVALATGALAVPAVALAAGDDEPTNQGPATTPIQQEQERQAPNRDDCPKPGGGGGGSGGSENTLL